MFYNKDALRNFGKFTGKHPCQGLFFNKVAGRPEKEITKKAFNFIKKESLAQVLSCEFGKISKNTFCYRTPPVAASDRYSAIAIPANIYLFKVNNRKSREKHELSSKLTIKTTA